MSGGPKHQLVWMKVIMHRHFESKRQVAGHVDSKVPRFEKVEALNRHTCENCGSARSQKMREREWRGHPRVPMEVVSSDAR